MALMTSSIGVGGNIAMPAVYEQPGATHGVDASDLQPLDADPTPRRSVRSR
jgi:hypothetical protein